MTAAPGVRTTDTTLASEGQNLVFILGAPRSGTTWLQRMLGAHPDVVTTQETALHSAYCAPLLNAWNQQLGQNNDPRRRGRTVGLPTVLTTEEFRSLVTAFAGGVYNKAFSLKRGARIVVDKYPEHSLHVHALRTLFPAAAFLHIVRDGRDVADSIVAASRGWGARWAPSGMREAARTWQMHVQGAQEAAAADRYMEVRYEDLLADTDRVLDECLRFVGVSATAEARAALIAHAAATPGQTKVRKESIVWSGEVARQLGDNPSEPEGFFRAGVAGGWKNSWSVNDALVFDAVAGATLEALGYDKDQRLVSHPVRRARSRVTARVVARAAAIGWRLHTMLGRRGIYVHLMRIPPYPPAQKNPH